MTDISQLQNNVAASASPELVKASAIANTQTPSAPTDNFGPAVSINLSPAAQSHISSTAVSSNVSASEDSSLLTSLRKVAEQVGMIAASQLVDRQGNIDTVGLAREIAKQHAA